MFGHRGYSDLNKKGWSEISICKFKKIETHNERYLRSKSVKKSCSVNVLWYRGNDFVLIYIKRLSMIGTLV